MQRPPSPFRFRNLTFVVLLAITATTTATAEPLDFNRDIRPILSAKCFACHGPDGQDRKADLRLDVSEGAFAKRDGVAAIVPRKPAESELIRRLTTTDADELMPPPKHKNPLTPDEIARLNQWITEGAPYARHWAFDPVERPAIPETADTQAPSNHPIDPFIAAELQSAGLDFSPEATPETLVRRLHLDLTGLPPSPAEIDAFLKDPKGSYEATIDRLMASPRFAERLALEWLDVARFADTNGYSIDDHRDMWIWRDWVINAFATNLPYDEFIRVQLAGDLLDNPTESQRIATGFLRNAMNTHEGGTIPEEYRVARIADQIDTVSTAFLGLTVKCAQCHDHKYDPISQRDYFRLFAFFNTTSEPGQGAGRGGNTKPLLNVSPILQDEAGFKRAITRRITALKAIRKNPSDYLAPNEIVATPPPAKHDPNKPSFPFPKDKSKLAKLGLSWIWVKQSSPTGQAWFRKTFPIKSVPKTAKLFISCDNEATIFINGKRLGQAPNWMEPVILDLAPHLRKGTNLLAIAGKNFEGRDGAAGLLAVAALPNNTFLVTDTTWTAAGQADPTWKQPNGGTAFEPAIEIAPHGKPPWGNVLKKGGAPKPPKGPPKNSKHGKLDNTLNGEITLLEASLTSGTTSVMIMDSGAPTRKTPILIRGAYDQHGETVEAGVPDILGPLAAKKPTRLDLATWLTDPAHPLTARVTVNRYWQLLFGTGLVKTTEDFGSQGEWPSHPELLDWLAAEIVASGWDVRALLKTMLTSRTYRQSSDTDTARLEADPYNRLLSHAPRFRLPAEFVRDSALSIGGLLDPEVGGPSVYPPQPKGLWKEVSHFGYPGFFSAQHHFPDEGSAIFRRSLYTFWKRTSPPPVMATFDAPNRETCAVRRSRTNTPLQALALMNEPQFLAAARGLARRMSALEGDLAARLQHGFRLATARLPTQPEQAILQRAYKNQKAYFAESPTRAQAYLGSETATPEAAALASVASLLLNLDEAITRD